MSAEKFQIRCKQAETAVCDLSTPEQRAAERSRRVALTAMTMAFGKFLMICGPFITIPVALQYLGVQRYGIWMTVTSITGFAAFADFGLGNGLVTSVSQKHGVGNHNGIREDISSAFFMLFAIGAVILAALYSFWHAVPWSSVLNTSSEELTRDGAVSFCVIVGAFCVGLPLMVVQRTQLGLQEGFQSNLWQSAGSVVSVCAVFVAVWNNARLPVLVVSVAGVPVLFALFNYLHFFCIRRRDLMPRWSFFSRQAAVRLMRTGILFFLVSGFLALVYSSDNIILAHVLGHKAVTSYAIPARLASLLITIPQMLFTPMWSANGEALARGDIEWVKKTTRRIIKLTFWGTMVASVLFVSFTNSGLALWLKQPVWVSHSMLAGLAVFALGTAVAGPMFMILNGAGRIWFQVKLMCVYVPAAICLKLFLARHFGVAGVAWGAALAYCAIILPCVATVTSEHCAATELRLRSENKR